MGDVPAARRGQAELVESWLVGALDEAVRAQIKGGGNIAAAKVVGKMIAERARAQGVEQVVFDRGGYRYHGRVQALAEAAREAGLKF